MGPNALAIVFAPCILRTQKVQPAQDSLHDIARQTSCIEAILVHKMKTVSITLESEGVPKRFSKYVFTQFQNV